MVAIMGRGLEQIGGQHGRQRQAEHQRDAQRDGDSVGQGREHLALHALQRHQRQEDEDDDANAEDHGSGHLDHGAQDDAGAALAGFRCLTEQAKGVFHDHHRSIHHQADGYRQAPQRHEIGRNAQIVHAHKGEQRGEHQRRHHDQRGADIAKEQEEDHHHQHDAFHQHLGHRAQRRIHQFGTVVIGHDLEAIGQHALGVDQVHLLLDLADHLFGIAARHHHHHAAHAFGGAVFQHRAFAHARADFHLGHIAQIDRLGRVFADDDGAQVVLALHQTLPADQILFGKLGQCAAGGIGVVAGDRLKHLGHGHFIVAQLVGIDQHLILARETALRIDFGDAHGGAQQRAHHPVLHLTALGQFFRTERAAFITLLFQRILVNLAKAGGDRPQPARDAR